MNSKALKPIAFVATLALLLAAVGVWWFFSGDPVAEVSLDAAAESVTTTIDDS